MRVGLQPCSLWRPKLESSLQLKYPWNSKWHQCTISLMSLQSGVILCEILALIMPMPSLIRTWGCSLTRIFKNPSVSSLCFTPVFLKILSQLLFSVRNHPILVYIPCTPDNFSHWFPSPTPLSFTFHFFTPQIHLPVSCFLFLIFTTSSSDSVLDPTRLAPFTLYLPTFLLFLSSCPPSST